MGDVSVIDGSNNQVVATIPVGGEPLPVAYIPINGDVHVGDSNSSELAVIAGSTNEVVGAVAVGSGPADITFDPANGYVYVADSVSDTVSVLSPSQWPTVPSLSVTSSALPASAAFPAAPHSLPPARVRANTFWLARSS